MQCSSFPPEGATGTSGYRFEYYLHLIKFPSQLNRESIYTGSGHVPHQLIRFQKLYIKFSRPNTTQRHQNIRHDCVPTCIPVVKLVGEMAKLFDGANRYILFIQLLALLLGVCFISPSLQLSEKRLLPRNTEGNAVSNTARA